MTGFSFKSLLKCGSAAPAIVLATVLGMSGEANAASTCSADPLTSPDTVVCTDASTFPEVTANGTYTDGATFSSNANGGFTINAAGLLAVTLSGQVNSSTASNWTSAVNLSATGDVSFTNSGTINSASSGTVYGAYVRGQATTVSSGTVQMTGGYGSIGVATVANNGDNTTTGGTTTVSGVMSRGILSDAFVGNNLTNTGTVVASGTDSWGVVARAMNSANGCDGANNQSVTVNVTGNVTANYVGITTLACGNSTITVNAGRTVTTTGTEGQTLRSIATGSSTVTVNGQVTAASTSQVAIDIRSASSATSINNGGSVSGTFSGDEGDDSITINAGGLWTNASTSDFLGGSDSLTNAGTVNANAAQFAGLETFSNTGTLNIAGGSFALSGATTFENTGTVNIAAGATTITSNAAFYNNGVISMQNGSVGDVLTIANDYISGANATVLIDVSGEQADRMVVNGTQSGTTTLYASGPASISSSGVLVASIEESGNGSSTSANAARQIATETNSNPMNFMVANKATALIDYRLRQEGNDIYLFAAPNAYAFQPLALGLVAEDLWYQTASVIEGQGVRGSFDSGDKLSAWGQLYAGRNRTGGTETSEAFGEDVTIDGKLTTETFGAQLGLDALLGATVRVGASIGYAKADADFRAMDGSLELSGWNIGGYVRLGNTTGFYGTILAKVFFGEAEFTSSAFDSISRDPNVQIAGLQAKAGYRWPVAFGKLDASASLAFTSTDADSFSVEGIDYDYSSDEGARGSLGLTATFGQSNFAPYLSGVAYVESGASRGVTMSSGSESDKVRTNDARLWGRVEAGFANANGNGPSIAAWLDVGDVRGVGLKAGLRF